MNKASGGDGIPVELFQILKDDAVRGVVGWGEKKDDAVKVLHSTGKLSSGHRTGKGQFSFQCQRMLKLLPNCTHLTH